MTTIAPDPSDTWRTCETFGCPNPGERFYQLAPGINVWFCSECIVLAEDADVGSMIGRLGRPSTGCSASAAGEISPGVEAATSLPSVNTALVAGDFSYKFEVKEGQANSFQAADVFKIEVSEDSGVVGVLFLKHGPKRWSHVHGHHSPRVHCRQYRLSEPSRRGLRHGRRRRRLRAEPHQRLRRRRGVRLQ